MTDNAAKKYTFHDKMHRQHKHCHSVYDVVVITQGDDHGKRTATQKQRSEEA
ncbi:hypothetical protein [Nitrosomonas sp.]|uniref:hypothetical protein n=1 Tax=Nitrosomonas sp. TaxID=42353 RepID=UPI00272F402F|nr:hypothetical protein [Nitrosomonas sp.]